MNVLPVTWSQTEVHERERDRQRDRETERDRERDRERERERKKTQLFGQYVNGKLSIS